MLASNEVYQRLRAVDIAPVLSAMDTFHFHPTGNVCGEVTDHICPHPAVLVAFIAGLELGGIEARAFLRKLPPRQGIEAHVDAWVPADQHWRRFQVPLTTHPDIVMRWPDDDVSVHLEPGWLYEVRYDRTHEVVNDTDSERIHLQIDQMGATI